jgi:nicotinate (nicotinamide) nucleotide adenylyltransferase
MEFCQRAAGLPTTLGVFPGTFNPVTVAHVALAHAALRLVDEVVFILPRALPHKTWSGASFDDRLSLLLTALAGEDRISIASSVQGLFVEIAAECRAAYRPDIRMSFLCGADAAQRIATWDYGDPAAFTRMMEEFDLLVAERGLEFDAPHRLLDVGSGYTHVSASEVRQRILRGEPWEHLVPAATREQVRRIYSPIARP